MKSAGNFKVCVCGGSGGIGQPLSMLMALDPNVKAGRPCDKKALGVPKKDDSYHLMSFNII